MTDTNNSQVPVLQDLSAKELESVAAGAASASQGRPDGDSQPRPGTTRRFEDGISVLRGGPD